jgi:hypothetical protein
MSRWLFTVIAVAFFLATVASGWVHGSLVNRWGEVGSLQAAAAKLDRPLPERLGPWRLVKNLELEPGVDRALQCAADLQGIYTNEQTGDTVIAAVLCGPSGPLSVHTPEICYSANDYEVAGESQQWTLTDQQGRQHSLWKIHANSRHSTQPNLRILYGWSRGREWQAVRGPRFALAGLPVVYKLQLAGPARDNQSSDGVDPCQDFLARFITQIQPRLVSATPATTTPTN